MKEHQFLAFREARGFQVGDDFLVIARCFAVVFSKSCSSETRSNYMNLEPGYLKIQVGQTLVFEFRETLKT